MIIPGCYCLEPIESTDIKNTRACFSKTLRKKPVIKAKNRNKSSLDKGVISTAKRTRSLIKKPAEAKHKETGVNAVVWQISIGIGHVMETPT